MKTLYCEVNIRIKNLISNTGVIKFKLVKDTIKAIGLLTDDVVIGESNDNEIEFSYFSYNYKENVLEEELCFTIPIEDFEVPEKYCLEAEGGKRLYITLKNKIEDQTKIKMFDKVFSEIEDVFRDEG